MIYIFKKGIRRQIILPMIVTMICSVAIIYSFLIYKNEKNIINSSVIFAKGNIEQYLTLREYYTHKVVNPAMQYSNLEIDMFLKNDPRSIPLPATMIHDLSNLLKEKNARIQLNLYSNYPFPNRENRVLDSFEKESLIFLKKNPKGVFYKRENFENQDTVRVVVADVLSHQTCVSCHNSIANTPKNDWKLGDVRGALEIIVPIEDIISINTTNTLQLTLIVFLVLFISISFIYFLINNKILNIIEQITTYVSKIKKGHLDEEIEINQKNELQLLSKNINSMRVSLKDTLNMLKAENKSRKKAQKEVTTINTQLEQTIEDRTKELLTQNTKLLKTLYDLENSQNDLIKSQKMAELGELVGSVTHEINTPLGTSITGSSYLESITKDLKQLYSSDKMTQDDFENYLNKVEENIKMIFISLNRVAAMIKSFKHIAVDQTIEEKRVFKAKEYIQEILLTLRNKTKKHNHKIIININDELEINSYPSYFYQIITNFINNAYLHGFEAIKEGQITIDLVEEKENYIFTFSDNGAGIDSQNIDKLFNEYYTTKRGKGGTGLGLNIVHNIVTEKLHGTIEVKSKKEEGTTFIITFPITFPIAFPKEIK